MCYGFLMIERSVVQTKNLPQHVIPQGSGRHLLLKRYTLTAEMNFMLQSSIWCVFKTQPVEIQERINSAQRAEFAALRAHPKRCGLRGDSKLLAAAVRHHLKRRQAKITSDATWATPPIAPLILTHQVDEAVGFDSFFQKISFRTAEDRQSHNSREYTPSTSCPTVPTASSNQYSLRFPVLVVEHCKGEVGFDEAFQRVRMQCNTSVAVAYKLELSSSPVFGLVTEGSIGTVLG
ncbi:hypothetical protein DXG03_007792 [Asterophora parasitica]|uniref:Uncharacterized protein n=1 Tax=Asterophora parasitica TaxID=117018 RepID=A0A9P7GFV9_9AGAR|nr:hypothetical protein DXG03_007792 [Asterophora parasitica]